MSKVLALLFPRYPTFQLFLSLAIAMFITIVATPLLIRILRHRNIGQVVRADGPERHLTKQGTPTMGGIILILATAVAYLLVSASRGLSPKGLALLGVFAACGLVGLIDDARKALKARSLGLRARDKLIAQFVISLAFAYVAITYAGISTDVSIPLTRYVIQLGVAYPLFVALVIMSATNAVNLTDGLDGLAGGTAAIVALAFAGIAFREQMPDVAFFAAAIGGACVGFLWWNAYPAAIFMGDTGSLALGGAIAGLAIVTKTELFLPLIGAIYVTEALSVIIQVAVYRYTRRRVFKMAPIHHHFEMLGWSETQVMLRFWIMTAIFAAWGFALYFSGGR
jgi:phospho-N-acetylmuramoyl-pentapeptide-transferase